MRCAFVLLWVLMLGLTGCGQATASKEAQQAGYAQPRSAAAPQPTVDGATEAGYGYDFDAADEMLAEAPPAAPGQAQGQPGSAEGGGTAPSAPAVPDAATGPLLIYQATVHIAVFETEKALSAAEQVMRDAKGYLVQRTDQAITFRVPAAQFEAALDRVLKLGDVVHRQVQARDVTDEFYDVQTRLRTLEAMRERMQELLARAKDVQEALAVERELGRIVEQIEQLKGKLKLLRELIAFSTITIEFRPRAVETIESSVELPFPWLRELGLGELLSL